MQQYYFDNQGRFVIENYAQAKPFSSFLPGIAGVQGFLCGRIMLIVGKESQALV